MVLSFCCCCETEACIYLFTHMTTVLISAFVQNCNMTDHMTHDITKAVIN